jgi:hypothetical protein
MRQVTAQSSQTGGTQTGATQSGGRRAGGRWIWGVSGVITAVVLAIPVTWVISNAGTPSGDQPLSAVPTRTLSIIQPVTSVNVQSYGAPIQVTRGQGPGVTVTEAVSFPQGDIPPHVTTAVSGGRLTLDAPECADNPCNVGFIVQVPARVAVTAVSSGGDIVVAGAAGASLDSGGGAVRATGVSGSLVISAQGGPVSVAGTAGANIDSGGGPVRAAGVDGPLTVSTEGGPLTLTGLSGSLHADTGGGPVFAQGVAARDATVSTEGGDTRLGFVTAPDSVQVITAGGAADLSVPGGPYALTTDAGGGPQSVGIATSPAAPQSINISTGGGPLFIQPAQTGGPKSPPEAPAPPKQP